MKPKRIVFIQNPVSTHANRAVHRLNELRAAFPSVPLTLIQTVPGGRKANQKELRKHAALFGESTLLCIAAGDGTVGMIIETLLTDPFYTKSMRRMPILPVWAGNANDLAHMLNGAAYKSRLPHIITSGKVTPVWPIHCTLNLPNGRTITHLACCYISFGATAVAAETLSHAISRTHVLHNIAFIRFLHEMLVVTFSMLRTKTFDITDEAGTVPVFEYIFFNGPRFAKISRVHRKLTDVGFHMAKVQGKNVRTIARTLAGLTHPKKSQNYQATEVKFTLNDPTPVQFDGETLHVPAGTKVIVTTADEPFYALNTLL